MENNSNFTNALLPALDAKTKWYDTETLPKLLDNYRLLHTCVKNLFDFLVKKSLITPDPYKLDKKISDITPPESTQFVENEKSVIIGQRFSDYESMLDFLCNYYKFSTAHLTMQNIKKLVELNNSFLWANFSINSNKTNTRVLANIVADGRQKSDALTSSMINDSLQKASRAMSDINSVLKEFAEFQREYYKGQIRKNVFGHPGFDLGKAFSSPSDEMALIKKNFTAAMGKVPFYSELIDEIVQEDQAPNKEELQKKVMDKMGISVKKAVVQETKVDTKAMLMESAHMLGSLPPVLTQIIEKVKSNHDLLESEHNSIIDKIKRLFIQAFNLEEKPLYYSIMIVEAGTGAKRQEKLNYNQFVADIELKTKRFAVFNAKKSVGYNKIIAMNESGIFDLISGLITDCNKMIVLLNSLDEFFKAAASPANKSKVKGLKIDITSFKNIVIKANTYRAEYSSYIEEAEQMKKLGIS